MFFKPRYIKEAGHFADAARRVLRYRMDLLTEDQITTVEDEIRRLEKAARDRNEKAVREAMEKLDRVVGKVAPPKPKAALRENCEVILVAIVIAAGVRAYLLEPFKIPTGSMQPTLNGIVGERTGDAPPNPIIRAFDFVVRGRTYFDLVAKKDEVVLGLRERSYANYFSFTDIVCERGKYTVFAPIAAVQEVFGVRPGRIYKAGQPIVRGFVDNGDFLLVNKMGYHFIKPARGDVFVFKTTNIDLIQRNLPSNVGSQHYIKRLAGLPGDRLRIDPPNLFVNGELASEKMFGRVMSEQNGYRGYSNGGGMFNYLTSPEESITVPPRHYFALGDNSYNSSDSRYWGMVPARNVTGKGFVVFWPFSHRWGFIE